LKDSFLKECSDGSCEKAMSMMLSAINGDNTLFKCDLGDLVYQGKPDQKFYRGHTDISLNMVAGVMNYVLMGVTI